MHHGIKNLIELRSFMCISLLSLLFVFESRMNPPLRGALVTFKSQYKF